MKPWDLDTSNNYSEDYYYQLLYNKKNLINAYKNRAPSSRYRGLFDTFHFGGDHDHYSSYVSLYEMFAVTRDSSMVSYTSINSQAKLFKSLYRYGGLFSILPWFDIDRLYDSKSFRVVNVSSYNWSESKAINSRKARLHFKEHLKHLEKLPETAEEYEATTKHGVVNALPGLFASLNFCISNLFRGNKFLFSRLTRSTLQNLTAVTTFMYLAQFNPNELYECLRRHLISNKKSLTVVEVAVKHNILEEERIIVPIIDGLIGLKKVKKMSPTKLKRAPKGYVTKFNGEIALKGNCIRLHNSWFEMEKDLIKINDIYVVYDPRYHVKDAISGEWIEISNSIAKTSSVKLVQLVKDLENVSSELRPGLITKFLADKNNASYSIYFPIFTSGNSVGNCVVGSHFVTVDDTALLHKEGFKYLDPSIAILSHELLSTKNTIRESYTGWCQFNNMIPKFQTGIKALNAEVKHINTVHGTDSLTNILTEQKPYTFGVEMETKSGFIPGQVVGEQKLNLKSTRDGSISGGEYVTGVLFGDAGFLQLKKITKLLSNFCTVDNTCGLHLHIGNVVFNQETVVMLFILNHLIEEELFQMLPTGRRTNAYCTTIPFSTVLNSMDVETLAFKELKNDDYKFLIKELYSSIISWLVSERGETKTKKLILSKSLNKKCPHPNGRYAGGRGTARYCWLNLVPASFAQKKESLQDFNLVTNYFQLSGSDSKQQPLSVEDKAFKIDSIPYLLNEYFDSDKVKEVVKKYINGKEILRVKSEKLKEKASTTEPELSRRSIEQIASNMAYRIRGEYSTKSNSPSSYTVEFRNHSGSLNFKKIRNWILICMGIISYAENFKHLILSKLRSKSSITLEDILTKTYSTRVSKELLAYIAERKELFSKRADENSSENKASTDNKKEDLSVPDKFKDLINLEN